VLSSLGFTFFTNSDRPAVATPAPLESQMKKSFRWSGLLGICLITFFASTAFYVVIVQLSFVLTERGYGSPKLIGIGAAFPGLAMPLGSVLFRQIRASYAAKLAVSFSLSGIGFFIMTLRIGMGSPLPGPRSTRWDPDWCCQPW
jgi:predicted MFS family arabinose efflux permease